MMGMVLGCVAKGDRAKPTAPVQPSVKETRSEDFQTAKAVSPASYQSPEVAEPTPLPTIPTADSADPFVGQSELSAEQLIAEVQARNPSLQSMTAAWQAAAERYPQAISLDDPMFNYMLGTQGLGPDGGYMVMASQKIPFFGKRQLRGQIAQAEADAACQDVGDLRLRLAEMAANALFDYCLVRRETEINAANTQLMKEFRSIAQVKYEANQVSQQDLLQADLELADLAMRRAELDRRESVAIARINTLLHRMPDHTLPPPKEFSPPKELPPVEVLRETALRERPDLTAVAARIRAEEANVNLACKDYYPDVDIVGKYDAFMPEEMRPQLGMNVNVPLWREKRNAAWREAMAKLQKERAAYADLADQARYEVQSTYAELAETQKILRLYDETILPTAKQYTQSARANYTAGKIDFLRLIDAQRQLYGQLDKYHQSQIDYYRRIAAMTRAVGGYTF
jgi:outer membrane protein, heavy metal efflux system